MVRAIVKLFLSVIPDSVQHFGIVPLLLPSRNAIGQDADGEPDVDIDDCEHGEPRLIAFCTHLILAWSGRLSTGFVIIDRK